MSRPEEIQKRHLGDEFNCDAEVRRLATERTVVVEAYIPVFSGAGMIAALGFEGDLEPGDEVRRLSDKRLFTVIRSLGRRKDGLLSVELSA